MRTDRFGRGTVSERLRSVVEQLDFRLDDRVLEIGCGHGVAATLICQRLETGHLTAIDRSEKKIRAAARRNAPFVEAGRTEFLVADLEDFDPGERRFDKIFAVRGASAACRWHIIRERSGCTTAAPTFWAS